MIVCRRCLSVKRGRRPRGMCYFCDLSARAKGVDPCASNTPFFAKSLPTFGRRFNKLANKNENFTSCFIIIDKFLNILIYINYLMYFLGICVLVCLWNRNDLLNLLDFHSKESSRSFFSFRWHVSARAGKTGAMCWCVRVRRARRMFKTLEPARRKTIFPRAPPAAADAFFTCSRTHPHRFIRTLLFFRVAEGANLRVTP